MSFPIKLSDRAVACPHLRFVYVLENDEKIRIGPKLSNEDVIGLCSHSIRVIQYIVRGSEGRLEIDCDYFIDLQNSDPLQSFHAHFYSVLSE